jgi:hypothetical protein
VEIDDAIAAPPADARGAVVDREDAESAHVE